MKLISKIFGNIKGVFLWIIKIALFFVGIKLFETHIDKLTNQEILKWILALAVLIWFEVSINNKTNNEPLLDKMDDLKNELNDLKSEVEFLQNGIESLQKRKKDHWI